MTYKSLRKLYAERKEVDFMNYIALYARQSIERENSISIETQLEYCKGMIRPDEKLYNVKSFSDKGYSQARIRTDRTSKD